MSDLSKLDLLLAGDSVLYSAARELDRIDTAIEDERWLQYRATKERLHRLGFDVSRYRQPPRPHRSERHTERHVTTTDDVEALVKAAKGKSSIDRAHREHIAFR
jgi:hypothetical protein